MKYAFIIHLFNFFMLYCKRCLFKRNIEGYNVTNIHNWILFIYSFQYKMLFGYYQIICVVRGTYDYLHCLFIESLNSIAFSDIFMSAYMLIRLFVKFHLILFIETVLIRIIYILNLTTVFYK